MATGDPTTTNQVESVPQGGKALLATEFILHTFLDFQISNFILKEFSFLM